MAKPRILIGPMEIAGYGANLKKGFRQLGVECDFITLYEHPFKYGEDDTNFLVQWSKWLNVKRAATPRSQISRKILWSGLYVVTMLFLLLWALPRYDVFIFLYQTSFFQIRLFKHFELPVLKLLNKKII